MDHAAIYDVQASDPRSALIDRSGVAPEDLRQIASLMGALGELREAEQRLSRASRRYMQLNETDMRALHYLIVCSNRQAIATPGGISQHLAISTASTTKLLDRLTVSGHLERKPHPHDRRARIVVLTQASRDDFYKHFGARLRAMRGMTDGYGDDELKVVTRFLSELSGAIDPIE